MKKLIFGLLLFSMAFTISAQSSFKGFFKPVDQGMFDAKLSVNQDAVVTTPSPWLFRPTVSLSAICLTKSADAGKVFDVGTLESTGLGLSYNHYALINNTVSCDYGFNLLFLLNNKFDGTAPVNMSVAGSVSAFSLVNVGAGYNFILKKPFLLTGIVYSFDK